MHVCRAEFINSMHLIFLLTSLLNDLSSLCPLPRLVQDPGLNPDVGWAEGVAGALPAGPEVCATGKR